MTGQEPFLLVSASAIDFLLLDLLQSSDPMKATDNVIHQFVERNK